MQNHTPEADELERLRRENAELRRKYELFLTEHRVLGWIAGLILTGPRLVKSIRDWLLKSTPSNPLPIDETAALAAAIIRRLISVGLIGLLFPSGLLIWQNLLIRSQNRYFQEQTAELRKQIDIQDEQSNLIRRSELVEAVYNGRQTGLSLRARVEALKSLVKLDNKLIDQGKLQGPLVNLRGIDFSCAQPETADCADLSDSWLVRTDFSGAKLRGAKLQGTDLRESIFVSSDLTNADLSFANLESTMFRERMSAPFLTGLQRPSLPWIPNVEGFGDQKSALLKEIIRITIPYKVDNRREEMILMEFVLERETTSPELKAFLNSATKAATVTNAKFNIASSKEGFESIDLYTRFPLGVVLEHFDINDPREEHRKELSLKEQKVIFDKIDIIQARANEIFGRYQVDIDLFNGPAGDGRKVRNVLICRTTDLAGGYTLSIDDYEALSSRKQEESLRKFCNSSFKLRLRGGFSFPEK